MEKLPEGESDAYYHSRPRGSQVGAHVSPQSSVLEGGRQMLEDRNAQLKEVTPPSSCMHLSANSCVAPQLVACGLAVWQRLFACYHTSVMVEGSTTLLLPIGIHTTASKKDNSK